MTAVTRGAPITKSAAAGLIVMFLLLGAGTAYDYFSTQAAIRRAAATAASIVQLCQAGNESRAQQVNLWDHILTISKPPAGETPAQRRHRVAVTRVFAAYIHHVFARRNCEALSR